MAKKKTKDAEPPPEVAEGAEGEAPAKKKLPIMMIAIAAGALVVVGGGGATAFMLLGGKGAHAEAGKEKPKAKPKKKAGGEGGKKEGKDPISEGPDGVVYYTMPDIVANIQTPEGKPSYLKLKLAFELPDKDAAEAIEPNTPRLNDMFQGFLRELRPEDIAGSAGSYQLRMEIQRRVNLVIAPSKVNAVLIEEMLIN